MHTRNVCIFVVSIIHEITFERFSGIKKKLTYKINARECDSGLGSVNSIGYPKPIGLVYAAKTTMWL